MLCIPALTVPGCVTAIALAVNLCRMLVFFSKCLLSIWGIRDFDPMTWKNSCYFTIYNCCYVLNETSKETVLIRLEDTRVQKC